MDGADLANSNGFCKKTPPSTEPRKPIRLSKAVGVGGSNEFDDVVLVQDALNFVLPTLGGPDPKLEVDGKCGRLTVAAIEKFQIKELGWTDSRIDPDKRTIKRLAMIKGGLTSTSKGRVMSVLSEALKLIRAARSNLLMAQPALNMSNSSSFPSLGREARLRLANRHFDIEKFSDSGEVLRRIIKVYDTMLQVFERPGGLWGPAAFEQDPRGQGNRAYAYPGGFFRSGQRDPKRGNIRVDSIYICEKMEFDTLESCIITIVHELAHFVGSDQTFRPISDNDGSYGWFDNGCIQRLRPEQKVRNAENYSNFAWDVVNGRAPVENP